jgi:hypothetical protein
MLQYSLFDSEPESGAENSRYYRVGFPVSLTVLRENVKRLLTGVICGVSSQGSYARLDRNGCWLKMLQGCCQANMDGFLEEYCGTWTKWGIMSGGAVTLPHGLEPRIDGSGCLLLPTPKASDGTAAERTNKKDLQTCLRRLFQRGNNKTQRTVYYLLYNGATWSQCAEYYETMMGVPKGWTDLGV